LSWSLFVSAFTFIFLAALPGRTTFLMLFMASRGQAFAVFVGAALAFGVQSIISVALGNVFAFLPPWGIHIGVGLILIYFAVHFWRDSQKKEELNAKVIKNSNPIRSTFILIFAAEWGDVSQLAIASFSARNPERLTVLLSAAIALWLIAGMAVIVGSNMRRAINPSHVQKIAAIGFFVAGFYLLISGIWGLI
jgi:putative Ca2+/H+ antiporter (TMEM165/GDT1 family)